VTGQSSESGAARARRWVYLALWPFPSLRAWTAFWGGFIAGGVAFGLLFVLGFISVRCGR
jgi:hypothetical protein